MSEKTKCLLFSQLQFVQYPNPSFRIGVNERVVQRHHRQPCRGESVQSNKCRQPRPHLSKHHVAHCCHHLIPRGCRRPVSRPLCPRRAAGQGCAPGMFENTICPIPPSLIKSSKSIYNHNIPNSLVHVAVRFYCQPQMLAKKRARGCERPLPLELRY